MNKKNMNRTQAAEESGQDPDAPALLCVELL